MIVNAIDKSASVLKSINPIIDTVIDSDSAYKLVSPTVAGVVKGYTHHGDIGTRISNFINTRKEHKAKQVNKSFSENVVDNSNDYYIFYGNYEIDDIPNRSGPLTLSQCENIAKTLGKSSDYRIYKIKDLSMYKILVGTYNSEYIISRDNYLGNKLDSARTAANYKKWSKTTEGRLALAKLEVAKDEAQLVGAVIGASLGVLLATAIMYNKSRRNLKNMIISGSLVIGLPILLAGIFGAVASRKARSELPML